MEVAAGHRTDQPRMGFAKTLASPSAKTREKAISLLVLWLTSQKDLKEDELKKIWKGLFYCVWHSDKAPVQADLIERLTSLAEKLEIGLSLQFFKVFLSTMRREWAGIDRLRMDKFYLLLRRYLAHMFLALEKAEWDAEIIKEFMDALLERTFLAKDQYAALGINLHYADVFLQELEKFLPLRVETFRLLMEPFLVVLANASDKSFLERVKDNIFGRLFDLSRTVIFAKQEGSALETSAELLGSLALSLPLASEVFRLASMPSTLQANRRRLYELHKEFEVLEKLLTASGITISLDDLGKTKKEAVPNGSADKAKKKKQKHVKAESEKLDLLGGASSVACPGEVTVTTTDSPFISEEHSSSKEKKKKKRKHNQSSIASQAEQTSSSVKEKKKKKKKSTEIANEAMSAQKSSSKKKHSHTAESRLEPVSDVNGINLSDSVVSNLRQQFDLLAGEEPDESDSCWSPVSPVAALSSEDTGSRKRKRSADKSGGLSRVSFDGSVSPNSPSIDRGDGTMSGKAAVSSNSSGKPKKVRFALKNNLVWKPFSPLPPQNVRVPPSATPRGSALKKGVPPGPIISEEEMPIKKRKGTPRRPLIQSNVVKSIRSLARGSKSVKKRFGSV